MEWNYEEGKDLAREAWTINASIVLDSLYGKLSALKLKISDGWGGCHESAYRQHSQERSFPSILQPDHCYVHFGCPVRTTPMVNAIRDYDKSFSCPAARMEAWFQRVSLGLHSSRQHVGGEHVPKESQQPVIDGLEEACHCFLGTVCWMSETDGVLIWRDFLRPVRCEFLRVKT